MTSAIIFLHILVFTISYSIGGEFLSENYFSPTQNSLYKMGMLYPLYIKEKFQVWRIFTSGFLHSNILHLLISITIQVYVLSTVEHFIGKIKLFTLIILGSVGGNILQIVLSDEPFVNGSNNIGCFYSSLYIERFIFGREQG